MGEINAPKYKVSRNVKLAASEAGISWTQPYIKEPITKAESAVPTIANVNIAPKFRKKYFWNKMLQLIIDWIHYDQIPTIN